MNKVITKISSVLVFSLIAFTLTAAFLPNNAVSAPKKAKGPKCQYRDLDSNKIITYNCDRFQSKGDKDSISPQVKIVELADGDTVSASDLVVLPNGLKALPIKIVLSPEFVIDFTQASNAVTEYLFLPQVDGLGHLHAYIANAIDVQVDGSGNITGVDFVENDNRSDMNGGFCVFRNAGPYSTEDYQVLDVECPLQPLRIWKTGNTE